MEYIFNQEEIDYITNFCQQVGAAKVNPSNHFGDGDSLHFRLLGFGAEYAFAKLFGLPFNDQILTYGDGGNDLTAPNGLKIQVKARSARSRDFVVYPDLSDFNSDIGVLMWPITPKFQALSGFQMIGWVSRVAFFSVAVRGNLKGERLYVPWRKLLSPDKLGAVLYANP